MTSRIWKVILTALVRIWKAFGKSKEIVCRYIEEFAQRSQIIYTGFVSVVFNVGNPSLCHVYSMAQFCLIQFFFFPQKSDFLSQRQFHLYHRNVSININIESGKELFVAAFIYLAQFNENTCPNVQFAGFVFCVGGSADITATPLQFCANLFLRKAAVFTQPAQIVTHVTISSDFLLHDLTSAMLLTNIGCNC